MYRPLAEERPALLTAASNQIAALVVEVFSHEAKIRELEQRIEYLKSIEEQVS